MVSLGWKLWRAAQDSHGIPERWLAGLFGFAGLALPPFAIGVALGSADILGRISIAVAQAFMTTGILCLVQFNVRVFRPHSRIAKAFAAFCSLLLVASYVAASRIGMVQALQNEVGHVLIFGRFLVLGWACFETSRYAIRTRRQVAIGLADPVTANRFLLWAVWTGVLSIVPVIITWIRVSGFLEIPGPGEPLTDSLKVIFAVLGSTLLFSCGAVWLSFSPPARYVDWLRRGQQASPSTAV